MKSRNGVHNHVVAVDLLGGDNAPEAVIDGLLEAAGTGVDILALGDGEAISILEKKGRPDNVKPLLCSERILPEEPPVKAIREKKDSTITRGLEAVKEGKAGAFVSAGSTGALVAGGALIVRRASGVDKPCLGTVLPSQNGRGVLFVDLGASSDVRPETLVQFGVMGKIYAEKVLGWDDPKVALLNIGTEPDKGSLLARKAYQLMQEAPFTFIGNIEARDVFSGAADVVVTDGFTGNVFLKTCEGTAAFQFQTIKRELTRDFRSRIGALLLRPAFKRAREVLDYTTYGGAPLLGLQGCVVKCHGSSSATAIANGIRQALKFLDNDVTTVIATTLSHVSDEGE